MTGSPAGSAPQDVVRVWYRSSAECPDGAAFIALLHRFGRQGVLAGVGDRVDFVVTLAHAPSESSGRLERQSSEQTVAIRDAVAASCEEVAEVLALSLELALQPAAPSEAPAPHHEPRREAAAAPALSPAPVHADTPVAPVGPAAGAAWLLRLGAQGTLVSGIARTVLPGAAVFLDVAPPRETWSARASLRGALGEREAAVGLSLRLLQARTQACWAWTLGELELGPCGGVEAGVLFVDGAGAGGRSDAGFWSGATLHARVGWRLGRAWGLEFQGGAVVPFVRHRFEAETGGEVTRSAAFGVDAALGVSFVM